jgi:hypothetical protein
METMTKPELYCGIHDLSSRLLYVAWYDADVASIADNLESVLSEVWLSMSEQEREEVRKVYRPKFGEARSE